MILVISVMSCLQLVFSEKRTEAMNLQRFSSDTQIVYMNMYVFRQMTTGYLACYCYAILLLCMVIFISPLN